MISMLVISPAKGTLVVELIAEFGDIPTVVKDHDSLTSGKIIAINPEDKEYTKHIGQVAYWRKYVDDARLSNNRCFIDIKDIKGFSYESTN